MGLDWVCMLSEQGQISAIRELANIYLKRWPAMMPGQTLVPVKLGHALVWDYLREVDRFCGNLRTFAFWTFLQKLSAWKWIGVLISLV